eukprot:m.201513 g.201513  ORF g.201513 m.201513 type:complete len:171 (-) comp53829_c1_seq6:555-1067(-)
MSEVQSHTSYLINVIAQRKSLSCDLRLSGGPERLAVLRTWTSTQAASPFEIQKPAAMSQADASENVLESSAERTGACSYLLLQSSSSSRQIGREGAVRCGSVSSASTSMCMMRCVCSRGPAVKIFKVGRQPSLQLHQIWDCFQHQQLGNSREMRSFGGECPCRSTLAPAQ